MLKIRNSRPETKDRKRKTGNYKTENSRPETKDRKRRTRNSRPGTKDQKLKTKTTRPELQGRKLKTRNQRQETHDRKLKTRNQDRKHRTGNGNKTGHTRPETRRKARPETQDVKCRALCVAREPSGLSSGSWARGSAPETSAKCTSARTLRRGKKLPSKSKKIRSRNPGTPGKVF